MRRIYLIRHAASHQEGPRRCCGTTDLHLSAQGWEQAQKLGEWFRDRHLSAVFCSDLTRAVQTARCIRPDPIVVPDLREMDAGEWEGLTFDEIQARWPEVYARRGEDHATPIPGGESFESARIRFRRALDEIVAGTQGDIALVSHGSILQIFLCDLRKEPLTRMRDQRIPWGSFVEIGFDGTGYRISRRGGS